MAIQTVNLTVPGGDTPRSANTKINTNFTDATHAASRLVGVATGNVMEVGAFGLGGKIAAMNNVETEAKFKAAHTNKGGIYFLNNPPTIDGVKLPVYTTYIIGSGANAGTVMLGADVTSSSVFVVSGTMDTPQYPLRYLQLWHNKNATRDPNGFLKGASPIAEIYSDKMDLNQDAEQQGGITFEKLGVGDYLVKGSLGFAQEGWYIETSKDANGNVLVAVVYEQLANNDLSIKTYAKKFDDETGDIVANLLKPRDIPAGRFISLRLHELPKEPPVMPTQDTSADAPAQTNNP